MDRAILDAIMTELTVPVWPEAGKALGFRTRSLICSGSAGRNSHHRGHGPQEAGADRVAEAGALPRPGADCTHHLKRETPPGAGRRLRFHRSVGADRK